MCMIMSVIITNIAIANCILVNLVCISTEGTHISLQNVSNVMRSPSDLGVKLAIPSVRFAEHASSQQNISQ